MPSLWLGLVIAAPACSADGKRCEFAGDPRAAVEISAPFVLDPAAGGATLIEPPTGGMVPLRQPVQGGFVLYVGALLRNLVPCDVTLQAQLRDPQTDVVVSNLDRRQADLEPAPAPHLGWWRPTQLDSLSTVPNIPACPDALGRGAAGKPATIELSVSDTAGRAVVLSVPVQPICPDNDLKLACDCACGPDFYPGKCGS